MTDSDAPETTGRPAPPVVDRLDPVGRPPAATVPARAVPRVPVAVFVLLVLFGGGLRAAAFFSDRCLWHDEAALALNLVNRTPRQLLDPLDRNQGAPVGFLLAVKATISVLGASERALRFVPFLASLAGLVGFAWVARRLLSAHGAILATALFALSPHLISYAAEFKQYASDASIAIGLLAVVLGLLEGGRSFARMAALAVAGAVAVWCSHPATFVLGGIGSALLLRALVARDRRNFVSAALIVACWLVSFAACYFISLKQLGANKQLTAYWVDDFAPLPPTKVGDLKWLAEHLIALFTTPGGFGGTAVPLGGFAAALALVGLREFARERWTVAVALVLPICFLLLASGLHEYPFAGRLLLFLVPFAVLLVSRGGWALYEAAREKNRFAALAVLGVLVVATGWQAMDMIRSPPRSEQLKPVLEQIRREVRPDDRVYVYFSAVPAYTFYTRDRQLLAKDVTFGKGHRDDPAGYRAELAQLHGRVWAIFSHPHGDDETVFRAMLDARGKFERESKFPGAAAWLYVLD